MGLEHSKSKKIGMDLTEGNILKQLLLFVLPLLLANIVQQLYNTVDMMVIGHFVGNTGTVGVSTGGDIATLVTFIATNFASAGQIYVAQLAGQKEWKAVKEAISTLLVFMAIVSLVITVICIAFCNVFLTWLNCPVDALPQARGYMVVSSLGLPFVFGYNAICGVMRGMGESKRPLLFITVAAISNIFMDLFLVIIIPLEAVGTAIATVIAQIASFCAALLFVIKNKEHFGVELKLSGFKIYGNHLKTLLVLGIPLVLQAFSIHVSQLICSAQINSFGLVASATNSIGRKVEKLINVFTQSVNAGTGAMVGQNIGARKHERVVKIVYTAMGCIAVCSAFACIICWAFPKMAFAIFTKETNVIEAGVTYMHIATLIFIFAIFQGPLTAVITGSGFAKLNFVAGMLDGVILRLGISFVLAYGLHMGLAGFFYGNALARIGPVTVGAIYFFSGKWKYRKRLNEK